MTWAIVSISLITSLFLPERVHRVKIHLMIARKKVFLIKQGVEPTIVGTNYRAKAPRFSRLDCGVIEQMYWSESPIKKGTWPDLCL
jgi:hypothetical protein